jgi:glycosyltransferase involved in cell wall biosynthesis
VTTVLFVAPHLAYSGLARRLAMLAVHLPRDRFATHVIVLGGPSPFGRALRNAGIAVTELGWRRPLDVRPLAALRRVAGELRPDVVHAWGRAGMQAALAAGLALPRQLVVSSVLPPVGEPGWLGRRLVKSIGAVIAFGRAEADRYRRLGVSPARLTEAPLAHDPAWPATASAPTTSDNARSILCVGPIVGHKGFRDAVWAFDILLMLYDDLRLVIAGDGPDRARVEAFTRVTGTYRCVRCVGPVDDLTPYRLGATVAWAPGRAGGVQGALEAMSAGLPVVAARAACLAEVVIPGETGFVTAPGDKVDIARQTRRLLEDEALRHAFGEAGRRRATEMFPPGPMASACADAYARRAAR